MMPFQNFPQIYRNIFWDVFALLEICGLPKAAKTKAKQKTNFELKKEGRWLGLGFGTRLSMGSWNKFSD